MRVFDDLVQVRAFVSIVEHGSISAAARHLKLAQPTVSRQLALLEEKCGVALLRRDTHTMRLTEAGHRLLPDARALLVLADESEQRMRDEQRALSGHIRMFATIDFGQSVVTRLVASFMQANPAVTVELSLSNRPLHMIQEGCDLGVVAGEIADDSVVARLAGEIVRYPVAAPALVDARGVPRDPGDVSTWPWLTLSGAHFGGAKQVLLDGPGGETRTLTVTPLMSSEGVTSLREASRAGIGIAVLPDWLVREDVVSGRLLRVLPQWSARPLQAHVVFSGQRLLPARVRALADFALQYMAAVLAPGAK
jgi:DNA-binding transcriptional LysR family regulator